ncbi:MAG TPA: hypothetical protein VGR00_12440, partial [Thermoanaerobaculia bacterium]|nr:hypothetical protein [Thermoanaerobaculia bacterium]
MECPDVLEATVARLAGEPHRADDAARIEHLAACSACSAEARALEEAWSALDDGNDAVPSPAWRRETLERLAAETLARKIRPFPVRRVSPALLQVAAVLIAGVAGFLLARQTSTGGGAAGPSGQPMAMIPFKANETLDASRAVPDLSQKPRLANVAYRGADPAGRIGISFDVTTRYTLVGKPEEKGIANLLAYLVSSSGETEGARG